MMPDWASVEDGVDGEGAGGGGPEEEGAGAVVVGVAGREPGEGDGRRRRCGRVDQDRAGGDGGAVADVVGAGERVDVALAVGRRGVGAGDDGGAAVAAGGADARARRRLRVRAGDHVAGDSGAGVGVVAGGDRDRRERGVEAGTEIEPPVGAVLSRVQVRVVARAGVAGGVGAVTCWSATVGAARSAAPARSMAVES